jgi:hypothetical protein
MHECNGVAKFRSHPPMTQAVCLSSQSVPFNMRATHRQCGGDEGQMRKLSGYLVAGKGAEQAAARGAVGIHRRFPSKHFLSELLPCQRHRAHRDQVTSHGRQMGAGIAFGSTLVATESHPPDSTPTGTPITNIYAGEKFAEDAIEEIAGAVPGFGVFD